MVGRANYQLAERSMASFWEAYDSGALNRSLEALKKLGYGCLAVEYALNPDNYYIPNQSGTRLLKPKGVDDDNIPIIALDEGQVMELPTPYRFHSLQIEALDRAGHPAHKTEEINQDVGQFKPEVDRSEGEGAPASAFSQRVRHSDDGVDCESTIYRLQPSIVLNADNREEVDPGLLLHEKIHVIQTLERPIVGPLTNLDEDLEAYAVQAELVSSTKLGLSSATVMACMVDSFRQKNLGIDNYSATPEFVELLSNHQTLHRII
jgi:hypothetical protein